MLLLFDTMAYLSTLSCGFVRAGSDMYSYTHGVTKLSSISSTRARLTHGRT